MKFPKTLFAVEGKIVFDEIKVRRTLTDAFTASLGKNADDNDGSKPTTIAEYQLVRVAKHVMVKNVVELQPEKKGKEKCKLKR
jgi:hypothetical protein